MAAFGATKPTHQPTWVRDFPAVGQGVIIFNMVRKTPFTVFVSPRLEEGTTGADEWINLTVDETSATFREHRNGKTKVLKRVTGMSVPKNEATGYCQSVGVDDKHKVAYWLSVNRDLLSLKYGKGYVMEETTCMSHDIIGEPGSIPEEEEEEIRDDYKYLFSPLIRRSIEFFDFLPKAQLVNTYAAKILASGADEFTRLAKVAAGHFGGGPKPVRNLARAGTVEKEEADELSKTLIDLERQVQLMSTPFVTNWSPIVKDSRSLTLADLDTEDFTFSASLPDACQELYFNVLNSQLDSPNDEYPLSEAIEYSIKTPGKALHTTLQEKHEFDDPSQVYLRVTLGPQRGKSAGIPYVLEIWPEACGSPIHNHGNCYAVISVLHGAIDIEIFNKHTASNQETPISCFTASKGNQTWISPNWFQTHKLWNSHNTYCATIQCYMYSKFDTLYYPYFDFVADEETIDEFFPGSDYGFHEMKEIVMAEYKEFKESSQAASAPQSSTTTARKEVRRARR